MLKLPLLTLQRQTALSELCVVALTAERLFHLLLKHSVRPTAVPLSLTLFQKIDKTFVEHLSALTVVSCCWTSVENTHLHPPQAFSTIQINCGTRTVIGYLVQVCSPLSYIITPEHYSNQVINTLDLCTL